MEQKETASIRFYVAGCMEFESAAECYEDLTLPQAVDIYKKIRQRNACNGPGIGFELKDASIPDYEGIHWPLFRGGRIDRNAIELIPAYANHPLVQQAAKEMEGYLPKLEKKAKPRSSPER
jgi:hypothetical protein